MKKKIYTVTVLNRESRQLLENHFNQVWVEGEISNLAKPGSGHYYFSLKDKSAQIRCALFKNRTRACSYQPNNGDRVMIRAQVSLFEGRGDFQLIVESLEPAGLGDLQRAYEQLKLKLKQGGYFSPEHKKVIPKFPRCIGIISSPTGAAIRDILTTLKRRFPSIPIIVYPTEVQGKQSSSAIVRAIQAASQHKACDTLILSRGGGSIEDLWGFNELVVAKAIYHCAIPIISGIGHDTDHTIADYIADLRAPTPTAAAETASPERLDCLTLLQQFERRSIQAQRFRLQSMQLQLSHLALSTPQIRGSLDRYWQQLDKRMQQMQHALNSQIDKQKNSIQKLTVKLYQQSPLLRLSKRRQSLSLIEQSLLQNMQTIINDDKQTLARLISTLRAVSPLATLERGYAIALNEDNKVIRSAKQVKENDIITVRLQDDSLTAKVL